KIKRRFNAFYRSVAALKKLNGCARSIAPMGAFVKADRSALRAYLLQPNEQIVNRRELLLGQTRPGGIKIFIGEPLGLLAHGTAGLRDTVCPCLVRLVDPTAPGQFIQ